MKTRGQNLSSVGYDIDNTPIAGGGTRYIRKKMKSFIKQLKFSFPTGLVLSDEVLVEESVP